MVAAARNLRNGSPVRQSSRFSTTAHRCVRGQTNGHTHGHGSNRHTIAAPAPPPHVAAPRAAPAPAPSTASSISIPESLKPSRHQEQPLATPTPTPTPAPLFTCANVRGACGRGLDGAHKSVCACLLLGRSWQSCTVSTAPLLASSCSILVVGLLVLCRHVLYNSCQFTHTHTHMRTGTAGGAVI